MKSRFFCPPTRFAPETIAVISGSAALLVGFLHLFGYALSESAIWAGPIGLRKPAMFGFSVGVTLISFGWLLRYWAPRARLQMALTSIMSGALLLEVAIIALQRYRGVPSHFNMATVLDGILWSMMGLAITVFALLAIVQAALSFVALNAPPAMRTAIRGAMLLLVFSQVSGQLIVLHGSTVVFHEGEFVAANIARTATFGAAGNLKLPHAIALHGMQVLPLLGAVITRLNLAPSVSRLWVSLSAAGFFGIVLTAQLHAYTGRAVTDLDPITGAALIAGFVAFALPWLQALSTLAIRAISRRPSAASAATSRRSPCPNLVLENCRITTEISVRR